MSRDTERIEAWLRESTVDRWRREGRAVPRRPAPSRPAAKEDGLARFSTKEAAEAFMEKHDIAARAHDVGREYILVFPGAGGMYAVDRDGKSATLLEDW